MIHCSDGQLTCPPPETVGMSHISGTFTGAGVWLLLSNWLVPGGLTIMGGVLLAGGDGVLSGLSGRGGEGDFHFLAFFFGSMNFFFNLGFYVWLCHFLSQNRHLMRNIQQVWRLFSLFYVFLFPLRF